MMNKWAICNVKNEDLRWLRKIVMQRHANQSSLPVIGHVQSESGALDQASFLPDQEPSGLIGNQDAAVSRSRDGRRCVQVRGECVSNETWRKFDSQRAASETGKPSQ